MEKHLVRAWLLQHPRVECDGKPLNIRLKKAQGLLRRLCDRMDQPPAPLDRYLDQSCESYCAQSRSALKGKAGVFELELLHRLDLGSADPLPGLLQVTEN